MFSVTLDPRSLQRFRLGLEARAKRVPLAMAKEMRAAIIENSKSSKDIRGAKFKKYVPEYEKWRTKHGLSRTPDLRVSGDLLDHQVTLSASGGVLLKPSSKDSGKAQGNQKTRKFYPEQESDITPKLRQRMEKAALNAFYE